MPSPRASRPVRRAGSRSGWSSVSATSERRIRPAQREPATTAMHAVMASASRASAAMKANDSSSGVVTRSGSIRPLRMAAARTAIAPRARPTRATEEQHPTQPSAAGRRRMDGESARPSGHPAALGPGRRDAAGVRPPSRQVVRAARPPSPRPARAGGSVPAVPGLHGLAMFGDDLLGQVRTARLRSDRAAHEKEPRPWARDRSSVAYENSSACGTWAVITCTPSALSIPRTRPRRPLRSRLTSPMYSSGTRISTSMIGSRSAGFA